MEPSANNLISAEHLYDIQRLVDCQIAPDGRHVAYTVGRVDRKSEKKYLNLWLANTADSSNRQFTFGDWTDSRPRWSPDGKQIALLSNRKDGKAPQLYLMPADGGEARPLCRLDGTMGSYAWSPDGTKIVFGFRKKDADAAEREADEQKKKLGVVAHHITRLFYKFDGIGYLPAEKWHIWVVNVADGTTTQLTDGEYNENRPTWSPDSSRILFVSNRSDNPDIDLDAARLYTIAASGGAVQPVPAHNGQAVVARYSPDGKQIAYLGRAYDQNWWQNISLYVVPAEGGSARNLTAAHDLTLRSSTLGDIEATFVDEAPLWSADGRALYFQVTRHGKQPIFKIDAASAELTAIIPDGVSGTFTLSQDQTQLAYWHAHFNDPGQIALKALNSPAPSQTLTAINAPLLNKIKLGTVETIDFQSKDGTPLQGWVLTPPNFDPSQKYPSILEIHGGPQTQYGDIFMHEFQYLAAQGYVVYFCNPRGSQGFGDDFAGAIHGRWGTVDYEDIIAWVDVVQAKPYIDRQRMGITGGSYGGYMTASILGRDQRFKAAVVQRAVTNWASMFGSADFNYAWEILAGDPQPWDNPQRNWEQSPLSRVKDINTPTLIIHSEKDYRVNLEQGEQLYVALRLQGVATEFVIFPDETHGLSRVGRTDRRIARLQHLSRWFNTYL